MQSPILISAFEKLCEAMAKGLLVELEGKSHPSWEPEEIEGNLVVLKEECTAWCLWIDNRKGWQNANCQV